MSMNTTATWRSSPPSFGRSRSAASGDFAADVPAEKIAHPFALAQAVDHRVETALQLAEFGAVEHHQVAARSPCSTRLSAARTTRTGVAVSHARIHIRMKPKISAAIATIITADRELRSRSGCAS